MSTKRIIKYKCMYCEDRFTREDLVSHVEENHMDMVPTDTLYFDVLIERSKA